MKTATKTDQSSTHIQFTIDRLPVVNGCCFFSIIFVFISISIFDFIVQMTVYSR